MGESIANTGPGSISSSLLERVRTGHAEAWDRLVHLYGPLVYGWCRQSGLQAADATDVVQEVFRGVATHIAGFRRSGRNGSFRGWLWAICRNKIHDHFRARAGSPGAVGGTDMQRQMAELPQSEPQSVHSASDLSGDDSVGVGLVHRAMEGIRGEFEDSTWEAFWRMTVQGHTSAEIAADLGMTKSAVRQAKYRVLCRLRRELQ